MFDSPQSPTTRHGSRLPQGRLPRSPSDGGPAHDENGSLHRKDEYRRWLPMHLGTRELRNKVIEARIDDLVGYEIGLEHGLIVRPMTNECVQ